jgi:hypothetical protein
MEMREEYGRLGRSGMGPGTERTSVESKEEKKEVKIIAKEKEKNAERETGRERERGGR